MRAGWYSILATVALQQAWAPIGAPLQAQESAAPWRLSYFPYLTLSPNDGVMGIARAIWFRQAEWGDRVTLNNSVAVEAGYSTKNAWLGRITWANPRLAPNWRLMAHAEVGHEPRFGDPDAPIERDRAYGWVDATRRLKGPLYAALRGGVRYEKQELGDEVRDEIDATARLALVVDLRDREYEVNRGALLEGGMIVGTAGRGKYDGTTDNGYRAAYAHLRGWYNPLQYLRLTGRFAWREPISRGPLVAEHEFPGWEGDFVTLGGHRGLRGLGTGQTAYTSDGLRDAGGAMLAGAEARFDVFNIGELGAISLLAFVDGGRTLHHRGIFCGIGPCDGFDSRDDWRWGAGGGVALRVLRSATLTITGSGGDGETRWYIGSGWSW
jgi:hypothetical protein